MNPERWANIAPHIAKIIMVAGCICSRVIATDRFRRAQISFTFALRRPHRCVFAYRRALHAMLSGLTVIGGGLALNMSGSMVFGIGALPLARSGFRDDGFIQIADGIGRPATGNNLRGMRRKKRLALMRLANTICVLGLIVSASLMMGACVKATPSQPVTGGYSYSELQIDETLFRLTFLGDSKIKKRLVEDQLLFRAAGIAVDHGYDYFVVVKQKMETTNSDRLEAPLVYAFYPCRSQQFAYYAYGFPWAYDKMSGETLRYEAVAFIALHKGMRPEDNPSAFDPNKVIKQVTSSNRPLQNHIPPFDN